MTGVDGSFVVAAARHIVYFLCTVVSNFVDVLGDVASVARIILLDNAGLWGVDSFNAIVTYIRVVGVVSFAEALLHLGTYALVGVAVIIE